jgi:hypothetical protein
LKLPFGPYFLTGTVYLLLSFLLYIWL